MRGICSIQKENHCHGSHGVRTSWNRAPHVHAGRPFNFPNPLLEKCCFHPHLQEKRLFFVTEWVRARKKWKEETGREKLRVSSSVELWDDFSFYKSGSVCVHWLERAGGGGSANFYKGWGAAASGLQASVANRPLR